MDIKQALKLFNLAPNAPPAAFKKRYHDLAAVPGTPTCMPRTRACMSRLPRG